MSSLPQSPLEAEQAAERFPFRAGLGSFSRLPFEIREQIWEDVLHDCDSSSRAENTLHQKPGIVTVMRLSRDISREFSMIIYRSLEFTIKPSWEEWSPSYVLVHSAGREGWSRRISHSYYASCGYSPATRTVLDHFANTPYGRFKTIWINIIPPCPKEPGETVVLWNHLVWLLKLLTKHMKNKSAVRIRFLTTSTRDWTQFDRPPWFHKPYRRDPWEYQFIYPYLRCHLESSFELLLLLVCRYNLLPNVLYPREHDAGITPSKVFQERKPDWATCAELRKRKVAEVSIYFDTLLDDMDGAAAAKLRLERFSTWSDEYLWSVRRTLTGFKPRAFPPLITSDWQLCDGAPRSLNFKHDFIYKEGVAHSIYGNKPKYSFKPYGLDLLSRRLYHMQSCNPLNPQSSIWTIYELGRGLHKEYHDADQALEFMAWHDSENGSDNGSDDNSDHDHSDDDSNDEYLDDDYFQSNRSEVSESHSSMEDMDSAQIADLPNSIAVENCSRARENARLRLAKRCVCNKEIGWDLQTWWDRYERHYDPDLLHCSKSFYGIEPFWRDDGLWDIGNKLQDAYCTKETLIKRYFKLGPDIFDEGS